MSSLIYPALPGLQFPVKRSYVWKTGVQEALSGKQSAQAYRQYPLIAYELTYSILDRTQTPDQFLELLGLYNQLQGRFDTFLFVDPEFSEITAANAAQYGVFGTGDGSTAVFQLVATLRNAGSIGTPELIQNLNGTPVLYDNGTTIPSGNYSIGPTGIVTFGAGHIPAATHTLTWSGSFYYRCRFDDDAVSWTKFMANYWRCTAKFTSVKL